MSAALVPSVLYSTLRREARSAPRSAPRLADDVTSCVRSLHVRVLRFWKDLTRFITDNIDPTFFALRTAFIWFH